MLGEQRFWAQAPSSPPSKCFAQCMVKLGTRAVQSWNARTINKCMGGTSRIIWKQMHDTQSASLCAHLSHGLSVSLYFYINSWDLWSLSSCSIGSKVESGRVMLVKEAKHDMNWMARPRIPFHLRSVYLTILFQKHWPNYDSVIL